MRLSTYRIGRRVVLPSPWGDGTLRRHMLFQALAASFAIMLVSLSGKLLVWRGAGVFVERNLHFFVSFAAGVLLVVAASLSLEIVEHAGSIVEGLPWIVGSAFVMLVAFRYIPHFHHHHEKGEHAHSQLDVNRIFASDAVHNIGDGIVIAASFAASPVLGIASSASIMVHEALQEISEFFVYREAGLSVRRALTLNFLTSSTILIGVLGAYFLLDKFAALEVPILGIAIGSYLVVVFHDLIPHAISTLDDRRHVLKHAIFFITGLVLMATLVWLLPHAEA